MILVSIFLSLPAAYLTAAATESFAASFFVLGLLGIFVPLAYERHWRTYGSNRTAIAWAVAACLVAFIAYLGVFVLTAAVVPIGSAIVAGGAFIAVDFGGLALLTLYRRRG